MDLEMQAAALPPLTPATNAAVDLRNTEDSGYHTPFTPSLSDSIAFNSSSTRRRFFRRIQAPNSAVRKRLARSSAIIDSDSYEDPCMPSASNGFYCSPIQDDVLSQYHRRRRSVKRSLDQTDERVFSIGTASTPTSAIAGDLEKLHVQSPAPALVAGPDFTTSDYFSLSSIGETSRPLSYPTTPVKSSRCKIAKLSPKCERKSITKKSPSKELKENIYPKRPVKKLNYDRVQSAKESSKCELQPRVIIPDKKEDIIGKMQEKRLPAMEIVLSYLGAADLYNFSEVCKVWRQICNSDKRAKQLKDTYAKFIRETKENCNAKNKSADSSRTERPTSETEKLRFRYIHNFPNSTAAPSSTERTPPGTPRTNKLRKFVKCGSLDGRTQLPCVRCCHPAKVTEESSGEHWAQCLSTTCSFTFCRFCKCDHHPGKTCHSLDAPSPTKRRKQYSEKHFDSKKCRRNLRRLMDR